jgi:hypothetical protein
MAICPKCEYEFDEKAVAAPDVKVYTLKDTLACCSCGKSFKDCAYWDVKLGYVCKECVKDGSQ